MGDVILGRCVAGFQPSKKLCKKLEEDYLWKIYTEHTGVIGEDEDYPLQGDYQLYCEKENPEIEAIKKEIMHFQNGETLIHWSFINDSGRKQNQLRTHPDLLDAVKELGTEATNGEEKDWKIVEVPDDVDWEIREDDPGHEWISETHRIWTGENDPTWTGDEK